MVLYDILLFIVSSIFLVVSGTYLVRSLSKISQFLKITEFTAAFILMSVATSFPELFVGISSATAGRSALSLGNVIGANIIDITLIMGIFILLGGGIRTREKVLEEKPFLLVAIAILPLLLFYLGGSISRIDGGILLAVFFLYSWRTIRSGRRFEKEYKVHKKMKPHEVLVTWSLFLVSLAALFLSSRFVIEYASSIGEALNIPDVLLGVFLLSVSTTLPELTFGVLSVLRGHKSMSVGNQAGTIITNSTLILGIVALISPIVANQLVFFVSALFLVFSAVLFVTLSKSGKRLDTTEGIALILLYVLFLIIELYFTRTI